MAHFPNYLSKRSEADLEEDKAFAPNPQEERVSNNKDIAVYTYIESQEDTKKLAAWLHDKTQNQDIVPEEIIIKFTDILNNKELKDPQLDFQDALKDFQKDPNCRCTALINGPDGALFIKFDKSQVGGFITNLSKFLQEKGVQFSAISLDIEPVFDLKHELNNIDFHKEMIRSINDQLHLPVSIYISPSKLGNDNNGMAKKEMEQFGELMIVLKRNQRNCVNVPAYLEVNEQDLEKSIEEIKNNAGVEHFKLILNIYDFLKEEQDDQDKLTQRLQFIKKKQYHLNGLCLYPLYLEQKDNKQAFFQTLKRLREDGLVGVWKEFDSNHQVSTTRQVKKDGVLIGSPASIPILDKAEEKGIIERSTAAWTNFDSNHQISQDRQVRKDGRILGPSESSPILEQAETKGIIKH